MVSVYVVTLLLYRMASIFSDPRPDSLRRTLAVGATGQELRQSSSRVPLVVVRKLQVAVPPFATLTHRFPLVCPALT